jgi:hypothetical protein
VASASPDAIRPTPRAALSDDGAAKGVINSFNHIVSPSLHLKKRYFMCDFVAAKVPFTAATRFRCEATLRRRRQEMSQSGSFDLPGPVRIRSVL